MRGGIRTVIIPEENRKDLTDIPKAVTQGMKIVPVKWIDEVLDLALERPLSPNVPGTTADAKGEVGAARDARRRRSTTSRTEVGLQASRTEHGLTNRPLTIAASRKPRSCAVFRLHRGHGPLV